jgi:hypothetical protein
MSSTPTPLGPDQYLFITPVWGDLYVERFVKVSLPSQLSAGNLSAIPPGKGLYLIYTRRENAKAIVRSPAYRRLKTMMPVSVRSLDDLPDPKVYQHPHEIQTAAYTRGIKAGEGKQTAYVFLTPDILLGDGSLASMVRLTEQGNRVLLVAGIRMSSEGAVACVAKHRTEGQANAPIPPRALVRFCLDNLHPISVGHVVVNERVHGAQHLYWKVADHGLLVRGFHLHPLVVWPRDPEAGIRNTLDDEYVSRACPDRADWHTVTDSDEICVVEFSDRAHKRQMVGPRTLADSDILKFMAANTTPDHREHVLHRIRFHTRGVRQAEWGPVGELSDRFVRKYLDLFAQGHVPGSPNLSPLGNALHERLESMFGQARATSGEVTIPRLLLLGVTAPLWVLYRILHYKIYRYLDRLYAETLDTREHLATALHQIEVVSARVEQLEQANQHPRRKVRKVS